MAGSPLPIHCKWYTVEDKNDLREIEGVSGAFFQPGLDDVGKRYNSRKYQHRICVHAIPASDVMEYHGMPAFQEVGPLVLDGTVMEKARICSLSAPKFPVILDSTTLPAAIGLTFGKKYFLTVGEGEMALEEPDGTRHIIKYGELYPIITHVKNSGTGLVILLDEKKESVGVSTESSVTRDILTVIIRGKMKQHGEIVKQKLAEKKESKQNAIAVQDMQREVDEVTAKCVRLEKEIGLLKTANNGYMDQRIVLVDSTAIVSSRGIGMTRAEEGLKAREEENVKLRENLQKVTAEFEEAKKDFESQKNELNFVVQVSPQTSRRTAC